jgi:hypothetical protein
MAGVLSWRNDRLGLARVTSKTANDEQKLEEGSAVHQELHLFLFDLLMSRVSSA